MAAINTINNLEQGLTVRGKLNVLADFYNKMAISDGLYGLLRVDPSYIKSASPSGKFLSDDGTYQAVPLGDYLPLAGGIMDVGAQIIWGDPNVSGDSGYITGDFQAGNPNAGAGIYILMTKDHGVSGYSTNRLVMSAKENGSIHDHYVMLNSDFNDGVVSKSVDFKIDSYAGRGLFTSSENKGIEYAADYSPNYTSRTLIDQGYLISYVNSAIDLTTVLSNGSSTSDISITSITAKGVLQVFDSGAQLVYDNGVNNGYIVTDPFTSAMSHSIKAELIAPTANVGVNSSVINIGTSNTAKIINLGGVNDVINITAVVEYQLVDNVRVKDKLATYNYGGGAGTGFDAGLEIEENGVITGFFKTNGSRAAFSIKAPANTSYTDLLFSSSVPRTKTFQDTSSTIAEYQNKLSVFAATTSSELASVISDETGTGYLVYSDSPTLTNPIVGTQAANDGSHKAASTLYCDTGLSLKQDKASWQDYSAISTIVGWASFTTKKIYYLIENKKITVEFFLEGTSDNATTSFTIPVNASANMGTHYGSIIAISNAVVQTNFGRCAISASANVVTCHINAAGATFSASGAKRAAGSIVIMLD